jgi:pseudaminic acid cytidylyltransferase
MKIAVIPARGGSKRIPRKNILPFAGKPMIAYAIEAARESNIFDHIIVSTDDMEIAAIAREYGAETPFMRPAELADDHTPTVPVIAHAIRGCLDLGWDAGHVCCIYPAVPLIESADIIEALEILEAQGRDGYAFPVAPFPSAVQRALRRNASGSVEPIDPSHVLTRTQDLEAAYYDAGQFYWGTAKAWLEGLPVHSKGLSIILPEWRVVDIDTHEDWQRAELMFEALRQQQVR